MKDTSESHLEKRIKQANKFGIPASDDVYYDKEVQEAFDERAPNLQSDESNQNLGFKRTKSINSNKESPSQPGQRNQGYRINTECDGNEGGCNGAAVKPGYCIDPAALTTEAHTLASTGIYNGAAVMPDYWFDPILATEARTLASTGEPADEITYTCIQSRHGIDKCISCNYKRVHESVQEQNHK